MGVQLAIVAIPLRFVSAVRDTSVVLESELEPALLVVETTGAGLVIGRVELIEHIVLHYGG